MFWIIVTVVVAFFLWKRWNSRKPKPVECFLEADVPKDTVILHQFGPALTVPSISPFVIKLETYLRIANIPYVNKFDRKRGPKGKLPWIQYNQRVIPDSQQIIEFLNAEFQVDLNKELSTSQLAVGHLVRRVAEESLYWILVNCRLTFDPQGTLYRKLGLPVPFIWYLRHVGSGITWSQGVGRHTTEEVLKMMDDDLDAIDSILGNKQFLFGDNQDSVTEFDCGLFGQLCQLVWQMPGGPVENTIAEKFPKLLKYCNHMKATFWPDWEDRLLHNMKKSDKLDADKPTPLVNGGKHQDRQTSTNCENLDLSSDRNARERKPFEPEP